MQATPNLLPAANVIPPPGRALSAVQNNAQTVKVHLASGRVVDAVIFDDESLETAEDIKQHLSRQPRPHWSTLGNVCFFTQAVEAVEIP